MVMVTRGSCDGKHLQQVVSKKKRRIRKSPGRCGVYICRRRWSLYTEESYLNSLYSPRIEEEIVYQQYWRRGDGTRLLRQAHGTWKKTSSQESSSGKIHLGNDVLKSPQGSTGRLETL